jgi:branched-chain amino acid transport system substrate-binding protein
MKLKNKMMAVAALAATSALVLAGCSGSGGDSGSKDPIIVGAVVAQSGGAVFPEAAQAVDAVFKEYNAAGGLNGRQIQYTVYDDKEDPVASKTAARDAVDSGAVALIGSVSLIDGQNAPFYEENNMAVVGLCADPGCFNSPVVSPTNAGPFYDAYGSLWYGSEVLGLKNICGLLEILDPATQKAYEDVFAAWTKATGKDFAFLDNTLTYGMADYTPAVAQLADKGCDAIWMNGVQPDVLATMKAAETQGMNDMTFLALTSVYSDEMAGALTWVGKGLYVPAEFSPYTDPTDKSNDEWKALMDANGVAKNSFAQGGYLAAKTFIQTIEAMDAAGTEINNETVLAAYQNQTEPTVNAMWGNPWIFGPGDKHQGNNSVWPMAITPDALGSWKSLGPWYTGEQMGFAG